MAFRAREFFLVEPFTFEERSTVIEGVPAGMLLLRPLLCGICKSDVLYFKGLKSEAKLRERLPMALLHEGVCVVEEAGSGSRVKKGQIVVPMPFRVCGECFACKSGLPANFCQKSGYMGATADGLARSLFLYPEKAVVELPAGTKLEAAALVEPASIALNAVEEAGLKPGARIAVIGDGAMGYLVALMLSHVAKIPKQNLFFVGISDKKLALAEDFAQTINSLTREKELAELKQELDVVFEAVGGKAQEKTVEDAIELLRPGGKAIVLGLSKGKVPVKLVDLVNKGLELKGSTRSSEAHYKRMVLLLEDKELQERLARLACKKRFKIEGVNDLRKAFEFADSESSKNEECTGRAMVEFE